MTKGLIGIIGGSGLYQMEGLTKVKEVGIKTPFGNPSDKFMVGELEGQKVAFLPRHGRGHRILPSELNFRANIWALKKLGAKKIISVSAVGSMKEELKPEHIVIPDQFFDRTRGRISTFFGRGLVGHIAFADPTCLDLNRTLYQAGQRAGATMHLGGTYICMEGPQFSTKAESRIYRQWGVDVIGMTNLTEAKLAREAEICYSTLALVTDYDCWHSVEESVTADAIIAVLMRNVEMSKKIIKEAVKAVELDKDCSCQNALATALITDSKKVPSKTKKDLQIIVGKYWSKKTANRQ